MFAKLNFNSKRQQNFTYFTLSRNLWLVHSYLSRVRRLPAPPKYLQNESLLYLSHCKSRSGKEIGSLSSEIFLKLFLVLDCFVFFDFFGYAKFCCRCMFAQAELTWLEKNSFFLCIVEIMVVLFRCINIYILILIHGLPHQVPILKTKLFWVERFKMAHLYFSTYELYRKFSYDTILGLTPLVNFTNILRAPFVYQSAFCSSSLTTVWLWFFWQKNIGAKCKMLMKLPPGSPRLPWSLYHCTLKGVKMLF